MILAIWEGTSHRQILDGMEVMERKHAHRLLFDHLGCGAAAEEMQGRIERQLSLPQEQKEATAEELFRDLAQFTAKSLLEK